MTAPTPERRTVRATYEDRVRLRDVEDVSRACAGVVSEISFDGTSMPVTSIGFLGLTNGVLLEVVIDVPDRDDAKPLTVGRAVICPWIVLERNGPEYLVGWARETIANLFAHEVAESFAYRGRRVFDPRMIG